MIVEDIMFRLIGDGSSLYAALNLARGSIQAISKDIAAHWTMRQDRTSSAAAAIQSALNAFKASQISRPVTGVAVDFGVRNISAQAQMIHNAIQAVKADMNSVKVSGVVATFLGMGRPTAAAMAIQNAIANLRAVRPVTGATDAEQMMQLRMLV